MDNLIHCDHTNHLCRRTEKAQISQAIEQRKREIEDENKRILDKHLQAVAEEERRIQQEKKKMEQVSLIS